MFNKNSSVFAVRAAAVGYEMYLWIITSDITGRFPESVGRWSKIFYLFFSSSSVFTLPLNGFEPGAPTCWLYYDTWLFMTQFTNSFSHKIKNHSRPPMQRGQVLSVLTSISVCLQSHDPWPHDHKCVVSVQHLQYFFFMFFFFLHQPYMENSPLWIRPLPWQGWVWNSIWMNPWLTTRNELKCKTDRKVTQTQTCIYNMQAHTKNTRSVCEPEC